MTYTQAPNQDRPRPASLRQISSASLANVIYLAIQSGVFLVMTPLVLKVLGPETYGLWTILAAIIGIATLANFGIEAGVTKYVSEFSVSPEASARISAVVSFSFLFLLLTGLLTGAAIFFLRHWIAVRMATQPGEASQLAMALVIISLGITPILFIHIPKGILFALVYHKVVGGIDLAQNVSISLAALIIGLIGGGIVPLAISLTSINLVSCLLLFFIAFRVTKSFSLAFFLDRGISQLILRYSIFAWISGLGSRLFTQADRLVVGLLLGPVAAGAYGICTGVAARLNSLAGSATQVLLPFASSYQAYGKNAEVGKVFLHLLRMVGCLLAGLGLAIIFWSDWLLSIWISPQFSLAYSQVFEILILAYSLFSMVAPGYYIAFGLGHPEVPALVNLGGAILMVLLIALLSPALGLLGAALANFSYSLELAVIIFVAKKLEINILTAMRSLLPPIVILISIYMVHIFFANTIIYNIVITIILISLLTFLALNNGRLNIIINHLKTK